MFQRQQPRVKAYAGRLQTSLEHRSFRASDKWFAFGDVKSIGQPFRQLECICKCVNPGAAFFSNLERDWLIINRKEMLLTFGEQDPHYYRTQTRFALPDIINVWRVPVASILPTACEY